MADLVSQADLDRLGKSVDAFHGSKALFRRPGQFTEDVNLAMRAIRAKFLGSGDRLTALLADVLGQTRPTQLSDASNVHDRLKLFGFGAPRSASLTGIRAFTPIDDPEKEARASAKKSPASKPLRQPQERGGSASGSRSASLVHRASPQTIRCKRCQCDVGRFAQRHNSSRRRLCLRRSHSIRAHLGSLARRRVSDSAVWHGRRQPPRRRKLQERWRTVVAAIHFPLPRDSQSDFGRWRDDSDACFLRGRRGDRRGSSRSAALKLRDALAPVTDSDLTPAGITSRTVRAFASHPTDLTVDRHVTEAADDGTLATFNNLVQEVSSKALAMCQSRKEPTVGSPHFRPDESLRA